MSPQHIRLVIRRRQEKAEKGGSEKEIRFQRHLYAVVLHGAGSAGGVMIDCMGLFLLGSKAGIPSLRRTAAHIPGFPEILSVNEHPRPKSTLK